MAYDEQTAGAQASPLPAPGETSADVFRALVEMYWQAGQDAIYAEHGEDWPATSQREVAELRELHADCDRWLARYEAAAQRTARGSATGPTGAR